jgi:hypothetical protein
MNRIVAAACLPALFAGGAASASGLEPHRAMYGLSLVRAAAVSGIEAVRGALAIEWQRTCDGWISTQRLGFVADTDDGPGFSFDVRFSSWESLDATQLRYTVRNFASGELESEFRGEARIEEVGKGGVAQFTAPDKRNVQLPPETLFPAAHLNRLLEAAARGDRLLVRDVFDGSGFDALTAITAVIGPEKTLDDDGTAWPVGLAFHNAETPYEAMPEFEVWFDLDRRGAMHSIRLDYGDFVLRGELIRFEDVAAPDC